MPMNASSLCGWLPYCKYLFRARCLVRSCFVFILLAQRTWPGALLVVSTNQAPFRRTSLEQCFWTDGLGLLNRLEKGIASTTKISPRRPLIDMMSSTNGYHPFFRAQITKIVFQ